MKKNDVFTFTAPNGVEVTAVVVAIIGGYEDEWAVYNSFLCYAQNRLFKYTERYVWDEHDKEPTGYPAGSVVLVDYAILPDYDEMLARYNDLEVAQAETASGM